MGNVSNVAKILRQRKSWIKPAKPSRYAPVVRKKILPINKISGKHFKKAACVPVVEAIPH